MLMLILDLDQILLSMRFAFRNWLVNKTQIWTPLYQDKIFPFLAPTLVDVAQRIGKGNSQRKWCTVYSVVPKSKC